MKYHKKINISIICFFFIIQLFSMEEDSMEEIQCMKNILNNNSAKNIIKNHNPNYISKMIYNAANNKQIKDLLWASNKKNYKEMNLDILKINGEVLTNRIMIKRLTKDQINQIDKKHIEEMSLSELQELVYPKHKTYIKNINKISFNTEQYKTLIEVCNRRMITEIPEKKIIQKPITIRKNNNKKNIQYKKILKIIKKNKDDKIEKEDIEKLSKNQIEKFREKHFLFLAELSLLQSIKNIKDIKYISLNLLRKMTEEQIEKVEISQLKLYHFNFYFLSCKKNFKNLKNIKKLNTMIKKKFILQLKNSINYNSETKTYLQKLKENLKIKNQNNIKIEESAEIERITEGEEDEMTTKIKNLIDNINNLLKHSHSLKKILKNENTIQLINILESNSIDTKMSMNQIAKKWIDHQNNKDANIKNIILVLLLKQDQQGERLINILPNNIIEKLFTNNPFARKALISLLNCYYNINKFEKEEYSEDEKFIEEEKEYQEIIKKEESQNPYKINMTYFK